MNSNMPSEILSRIPLPSLRIYTSVTVLLMAGCLYYSFNVTSNPGWKQNVNITSLDLPATEAEVNAAENSASIGPFGEEQRKQGTEDSANLPRTVTDQLQDIISFMEQDAICIWVSKMMCSSLILNCGGLQIYE